MTARCAGPKSWLPDTNTQSDLVRNPQGVVAKRIASAGEANVCTSIVVAAEFRFGAQKSASSRLRRQVDRILAAITVMPFDSPADQHYAQIRAALEHDGAVIGPNNMLIAADDLAPKLNAGTIALECASNLTQSACLAHGKMQRAAVTNPVIMREAVTRLMDSHPQFTASRDENPCASMRGVPNHVAHDHFDINLDTVWSTLPTDLPPRRHCNERTVMPYGGPPARRGRGHLASAIRRRRSRQAEVHTEGPESR